MDVMKLITDHYVMLYELIGLLIIMLISTHLPGKMKRYTRLTIVLLVISGIVHVFEEWTQTFEHLSYWRIVLTGTKYSIYPLILWSLIEVVSIAFRHKSISVKWKFILLIPELIMIPIYYSSQASHLVYYYIPETNLFCSGPLSLVPYILFGLYMILFIGMNIIQLKNYSLSCKIIACYIPIGAALSVVALFFVTDNPDYNPIFTSSLVFYYLFIYIHMANVDTLTGLLNRQNYYSDMNKKANRIKAVVSIDMNNLKYLNDNFGHKSGDIALAEIADVLIKEKKYHANVYRVGGDEFCIFYYDINEDGVKERIKAMRDELAKTPHSCAFGYSMRNGHLSVQDMINIADSEMYVDKKAIKEYIVREDKKEDNENTSEELNWL